MECILGIFKMVNDAVRVDLCGTMDNNLRGSGKRGRRTVLGFGVLQRATITKANGGATSKTARDTLSTTAAPNTEDIFATSSSTARERRSSTTAINTAALMSKENLMDTEGTLGRMEMYMRGSLWRVQERERVFSGRLMDKSMKERLKMTISTGWGRRNINLGKSLWESLEMGRG